MAKKYEAEFKQKVLKEIEEVGNQLLVARRYGLDPRLVSVWVIKSRNGSGRKTKLSDKVKSLEEENKQLKKLVADLALKTSILEDLQKKTSQRSRNG
jgi:transposase